MAGEPILGKAEPSPHQDYRPLTWKRFLALRAWARRVADAEDAPVYLVGSALTKSPPRDLDVSIVLPLARFVAQFGPIPPNAHSAAEHQDVNRMPAYMNRLHHYLTYERPYQVWALEAGLAYTRLDLKICPDTWWPNKDRLLLASPQHP
ncbi:MAG TPA: hypothetical protein VMV29_10015 [Ktedonobacterales bacterium]|nr:hypothetical protein [Ktedonobacterales bacterium]